jgi:hypothetical protein
LLGSDEVLVPEWVLAPVSTAPVLTAQVEHLCRQSSLVHLVWVAALVLAAAHLVAALELDLDRDPGVDPDADLGADLGADLVLVPVLALVVAQALAVAQAQGAGEYPVLVAQVCRYPVYYPVVPFCIFQDTLKRQMALLLHFAKKHLSMLLRHLLTEPVL